ncbi:hybrid sensor histidine kinase/response regulator [Oscillochloris sp. ZM17-4]|uniref:hybrid sensor histidine kinase/response regulator n=1 Tax=Oscillochloris sp. ZM17-4 TaxID=2866714 RepID=UPI001C72DDA4|nr:hybrid sensor histidine kinase/response regulator [Oscillochloris sp. ZM17-4]MBX0328104.1 hybrid sensor histidine kinase/response regulator [Oscillochloris sp. ZM17-4]
MASRTSGGHTHSFSPHPERAMPAYPGTILVVDDNEINRTILRIQLQQEGHQVETAEHGLAAIAMLRERPFDIVLLDLLMPEMDGFQVLTLLQADSELRHIPVIVISALDEMENITHCIEMGATDHLARPFNPMLLRARINASLAAKRLHDQEAEYLHQVRRITDAAAAIEAKRFDAASLGPVAARGDALGQLARVFTQMAREVEARERQLKQESQFKSALIGKITHELRSPFVSVGLTAQLIQRYAERQMLAEVCVEAGQLDRQLAAGRQMIDSVISYASLVSKLTAPQPEPTDMAAMIRESTAPLQRLAETREVELSYVIAEPLPMMSVDHEQLSEAIHHLVHNAIKVSQPGGHVRLSCAAQGGQLTLMIEDDGPGIAQDKLETIWDVFAQTSDDVQRGVEGLGMGLALVSCIIKAHRGKLLARSTPGVGSSFGFRIAIG